LNRAGVAISVLIWGALLMLQDADADHPNDARVAIAIHGGAGKIDRAKLTPEKERAYREKLEEALRAGHKVLTGGGTSVDACAAAVKAMEDSPLFNAGKGAVHTAEGAHELDAAIMEGA